MPSYDAARQIVIETAGKLRSTLSIEQIEIADASGEAVGRILAEEVFADREYPPFNRSTRDGYAVISSDVSQSARSLRLVGESKAGTAFSGRIAPGECVQIMTGAPLPDGSDAVVMIEYTKRTGDGKSAEIVVERPAQPGQNIVATGTEARAGELLLRKQTRLSYAELAMAAQVGRTKLSAYSRPRVAILSTGDEVIGVDEKPGPFQIRNSNSVSLAAQASLAGAEPVPLGNAPDDQKELRSQIEHGLESDILVLSGGVSMGKYDLVEDVLRQVGAEFLFDSVDIRPGRPTVFAVCRGKPVFGLPGNPVSTMVTFELFVTAAIDVLGGAQARPLPLYRAQLEHDVDEKPGLAHFLPAVVSWNSRAASVRGLEWQGSGDVVTLTKANCFLAVVPPRLKITAGEWADILPRRGVL
jgi:molybdopterin molybdotransferase